MTLYNKSKQSLTSLSFVFFFFFFYLFLFHFLLENVNVPGMTNILVIHPMHTPSNNPPHSLLALTTCRLGCFFHRPGCDNGGVGKSMATSHIVRGGGYCRELARNSQTCEKQNRENARQRKIITRIWQYWYGSVICLHPRSLQKFHYYQGKIQSAKPPFYELSLKKSSIKNHATLFGLGRSSTGVNTTRLHKSPTVTDCWLCTSWKILYKVTNNPMAVAVLSPADISQNLCWIIIWDRSFEWLKSMVCFLL